MSEGRRGGRALQRERRTQLLPLRVVAARRADAAAPAASAPMLHLPPPPLLPLLPGDGYI